FEATEYLSSSSYPTISDIRLVIGGLIRHFEKFINEGTHLDEDCMFADSIRFKLNEYWLLFDKTVTIATILDSSSKLKTFISEEKKIAAITSL
ncbi:8455_t:CDS:1, partial [Acaulospora morrowiae]